jgi:hypothetical protein
MRRVGKVLTFVGLLSALAATTYADEIAVLQELNDAYRQAWLKNDSAGVMTLFESGA